MLSLKLIEISLHIIVITLDWILNPKNIVVVTIVHQIEVSYDFIMVPWYSILLS